MVKKAVKTSINILFRYSTSHLNKTDLVKFHYALKGRNGKQGVLDATRTKLIARSVLISKRNFAGEIEQFLNYWRCKYTKKILSANKEPNTALIIYKTNKLSSSKMVRFYYALKGRDGKSGMMKQINAEQLARGALLISIKNLPELKSFFELWSVPVEVKEVNLLNA